MCGHVCVHVTLCVCVCAGVCVRACVCVHACVFMCACVCVRVSHLSGSTDRSGWGLGDDSIAGHVDVQLKSVQDLFCLVSVGMVVW